jgi:hypothetical protein
LTTCGFYRIASSIALGIVLMIRLVSVIRERLKTDQAGSQ